MSPVIVFAGLSTTAGYDEYNSVGSMLNTAVLPTSPRGEKMSSSAAGIRALAGLMRSLECTERRNSPQRACPAASAGVQAECAGALQVVATLQQQCQAVEQTYSRLQQLRTRLAAARSSSSYKKASRLMHTQQRQRAVSSSLVADDAGALEGPQALSTNSGSRLAGLPLHKKQQRLQLAQHRSSPASQQAPSLPALTVLVRALLQLAELQASPAVAAALRQQLLHQVKAAAAAAKFAGQPFSVAAALHRALPWLRAAVRRACSQAVEAAVNAATAAAAAGVASMQDSPADTAATLERALSAAAEEVQQMADAAGAAGQQVDGSSSSSMAIDMDALLQAEMVAALSAAT